MDEKTWAVIGPLYDERHDALVRQAERIVGADAEDVVHEAFVRIARAVEDSGKTSEDAAAMLNMTVRNLALNHLRDLREEPMELTTITGMIDSPRPLTAERGMFVTDFNEALRALPEDQAQAFILTEIRGLSQREAGEILEVSAMAINRRAEAARRTLARELQ